MTEETLRSALLTLADLPDDFFEYPQRDPFGPTFVSGDEAGRRLVDLTNMLVEATDPTNIATVHTIVGNPAGSFLFHNIASYPVDRARQIYDDFTAAATECRSYVMELHDGQQVGIEQVDVSRIDLGDSAHRIRWVTPVPGYTVETAWTFMRMGGILNWLNSRFPDTAELDRLSALSVDRLRKVTQQVS